MTAIDDTPQNRNFLSPLKFQFSIKNTPNVNFFLQKVNIPEIKLGVSKVPNPFVTVPYPGDHLEYGLLQIAFKIDEQLQNYLELYNWLKGLGKPKSYGERKKQETIGLYSDISLKVLNGEFAPVYEIIFIDGYPISLSSPIFNTVDNTLNFITASASFKYTYFDIRPLI